MRFVIDQPTLKKNLALAQKTMPNKPTESIMDCVKLEVGEGGNVTLTATGTEAQVNVNISLTDVDVVPGTAIVPAQKLIKTVSKFSADASISIELKGSELMVKSGRSRLKIGIAHAPGEWPVFMAVERENKIVFDGSVLAESLGRVKLAMGTEDTRYYLCGVCLDVEPEGVTFVATNGHILGRKSVEIATGFTGQYILPASSVDFVQAAADGEIVLTFAKNAIEFQCGAVSYISRLIDGTYPDYGRVIPAFFEETMCGVSVGDFLSAVDIALVANDNGKGGVKLVSGEWLSVSSVSGQEGAVSESDVEAELKGFPDIGVDGAYLKAVLSSSGAEYVEMSSENPTSPIRIKVGDDASLTYVVMPMRV